MTLGNTWRSWLVAVFGAWFVVDSFVYSSAKSDTTVFWSFLIIGALIVIGSVWEALQPPRRNAWQTWAVAVLSAWMAVSPWALSFSGHSVDMLVTLIVGVLGVIVCVWSALTAKAPSAAPPVKVTTA